MAYNQGKNPFSKNPLNFNSPLNSFDSLVGKLMNQGKSKEAATKIAGKVANAKLKGAGKGPTAAQKARMKSSPAKQAKPDFLDLDKDGNTTEPMKEAAKGSPANLKEKSPAELKSPAEKKLVGKQKNLPEGLKKAIEAAPESPAKMKSPMKKHGDKFREKAKKLSKGEQGDYNYDDPKVVKLLEKAKEADKKHEGSPAKKGHIEKAFGKEKIKKSSKQPNKPTLERQASAKALTEAKAKARAKRKHKGKPSPASMKSPVEKNKGGKRNPYTNSPMGDLSGEKVYGPATAAIAAGKKVVKKINKVRANAISTKNKLKHQAKKGVRKAVKAVKEFSKDIQERGT